MPLDLSGPTVVMAIIVLSIAWAFGRAWCCPLSQAKLRFPGRLWSGSEWVVLPSLGPLLWNLLKALIHSFIPLFIHSFICRSVL